MISRRTAGMTAGFMLLGLWAAQQGLVARDLEQKVTYSTGVLELPTYEFTGREMQPPLFGNSTVGGKYPFPPYIRPLKSDGPKQRSYDAVFLENEYLRLTYLPDFGGRFYSLYDKVAEREVFYANDVIKPAGYNVKHSFALFGIELTGPYDTHALTLYGEPHWFNRIVEHPDGSVSLVLGNIDPVFRMKVNFAARLYPGIAALQLSVSCYNTRDGQQPYMFWISGSLPSTEKTRFIYPMTRTIGHTTSEVADWPYYGDVDYSWDRNNKHMLGVFGIDIYDDFQGAYHHDLDYGVFRYGDRRVVQGMKMWTFGYSDRATNLEREYTDNAGPYIEVQSGRHVWDGHYEWLSSNMWEGWSEWWLPVSGIGGLTTTSRDLALNLLPIEGPRGEKSTELGLSPTRRIDGARVVVRTESEVLLDEQTALGPGRAYKRELNNIEASLPGLEVTVTDADGEELLAYSRPVRNPGRQEYTPFTKPLEKPAKNVEEMSVEEMVLEAEFRLKQMNLNSGKSLLKRAIERDNGSSRAHLLQGILDYGEGRIGAALDHLEQAIERDPYLFEAYYYLALCRLQNDDPTGAERILYYIPASSSYFANREFLLARTALARGETLSARKHLKAAIEADGRHLNARFLAALLSREAGRKEEVLEELRMIEELDPTNRLVKSERYFLEGDQESRRELIRLMGGQSQEALEVAHNYGRVSRWEEAIEILGMVEKENADPWGTPAIFYYTKAYFLRLNGKSQEADSALEVARSVGEHIDRFPFRVETESVLADAVERNPKDGVARFYLGCLLYHFDRPAEAIELWREVIQYKPGDFRSLRALGLAYAEQGYEVDLAVRILEEAVEADPTHVRTFNDLSAIYASDGRFDRQIAMLERALKRSPGDDNLIEGLITAHLILGRYDKAEELIKTHRFQPRHRTYHLRDKYRFLRYGLGMRAYNDQEYAKALEQFELALSPPVSLGVDDFQFETTPRIYYYLGRAHEALGQVDEAREAYERSTFGLEHLSGDRDSWNSENFHMVLALERLGRNEEVAEFLPLFEGFADSQMEGRHLRYRSEARYLLGLVRKYQGQPEEARRLMSDSLKIEPDLLGPRYELRGDALDPVSE